MNFTEYILANGRVPTIADTPKPWTYRGWLMYYAMLYDPHKRWNYLQRTLDAGRVLDEPIPRIRFAPSEAGRKEWQRWVNIAEQHGSWSAVGELIDWLAFALGVAREPSRMKDAVQEKLYRAVNLQPILDSPYDYIGTWLAEQKYAQSGGFYPTPHDVVEMMTRMQFEDGADSRSETVCDPCVGTGRFLLHASNYSLRLFGMEINHTILRACLVNMALFVPWAVFPLPESFWPSSEAPEATIQPSHFETPTQLEIFA